MLGVGGGGGGGGSNPNLTCRQRRCRPCLLLWEFTEEEDEERTSQP